MICACRNLGVSETNVHPYRGFEHEAINQRCQCKGTSGTKRIIFWTTPPGCMCFPSPGGECCIVQGCCFHMPQRCHHSGEALSDRRQKPSTQDLKQKTLGPRSELHPCPKTKPTSPKNNYEGWLKGSNPMLEARTKTKCASDRFQLILDVI